MTQETLPVAIIGAGPVGLAAAAQLVSRGEVPILFEAGAEVGAGVRQWGHVRVFSPWRYNVDPTAAAMLEKTGWTMPDPEHLPTGRELVDEYLEPLAALPEIRPSLRLGTRVLRVTRRGVDKLRTDGRDSAPFVLRVLTPAGEEQDILARAVIDASGTYGSPNPLGADGTPARGEATVHDRVFYGIPDVLGTHRARYAGRRVAVIGSGHSALNTLLDLAELAKAEPTTDVTWIVRRPPPARVFGGGAADALPARGALGQQARQLLERGGVKLVVGRVAALIRTEDRCGDPRRDGFDLDHGRRAGGGHRPPAGSDSAARAAARARSDHGGAAGARPPDRPQPPQLRHGAAPWGDGAPPSGAGLLRGGHEELRPSADFPDADGLRAGAVDRVCLDWRCGGRRDRGAHAAGDGGLQCVGSTSIWS